MRSAPSKAGYAPIVTANPADVPRLMREEKPNLVLLDLVLPGSDGIELMQEILQSSNVPILFLSVYGQDEIIARAFEMGAADYMVKPFSPTELVARIGAALRRQLAPSWGQPSEPYHLHELTIYYCEHSVLLAGEPVVLTGIEFRVLSELAASAGSVVTREQLLHRVWGPANSGDPRLLRSIIKNLRRKLNDDAANPQYIFTEPRVGYCMAGNPSAHTTA